MTTAVDFDPVAHRYTLEGRELISVTQVLEAAGFIDTQWYTDEAARRGTAVHEAVQRLHAGDENPSADLEAGDVPYFDAYLAFQAESGFVVDGSEERVCDALAGYAGTLDLRGRFPRFVGGVDVIDLKTGSVPSWVGYQTAAYARLLTGAPKRRWALNLRTDGTYRLLPLEARTDERIFLAALTVAHAKRGWL